MMNPCAVGPRLAVGPRAVRARGSDFVDAQGRVLTLRGINLAGSSKMPSRPNGRTDLASGFFESMRSVSFVDRPFPLADADAHFARLRAWGFTLIRLLVTWEAVEHAGPGEYDRAYLDYLAKLVERAGRYGLHVWIDPHQDVWSRFSGGDGAPGWTFEKVGLDVTQFAPTCAALVHQTCADKRLYPRMTWMTNSHKLACGTMFALFWASEAVAPKCMIDGQSAQAYLQGHYTRAMAAVARALRRCANVLGFGTMNEPLPGFVGVARIDQLTGPLVNALMPTPFEAMALGDGHARRVGRYDLDSLYSIALRAPVGSETVNAGGARAWLPGRECVWKAHGVWGLDASGAPRVLRADHFAHVDFGTRCYLPFAARYAEAVRAAGVADWLVMVELPPADLRLCPFPVIEPAALGGGVVHAPHWYDQITLFFGRWIPALSFDVRALELAVGEAACERLRARGVGFFKSEAVTHVGGAPTIIGEVGVPFDLNKREAYGDAGGAPRAPSLEHCTAALRATVDALEANDLSYALWNYTPEHTVEWGDGWNREDLSLYSPAAAREVDATLDPANVHLGGRALRAFVRPYAHALPAAPTRPPRFDHASRVYSLQFETAAPAVGAQPAALAEAVVFVPEVVQYPNGFTVRVSDGTQRVERAPLVDGGYAFVRWTCDPAVAAHSLTIEPAAPGPTRGRV